MNNLLVVDDEPIILQSLCEMVQEWREDAFAVYSAHSAGEALRIMEEHWIDIIMTDIHMPDMDGLDLMQRAERDWPHVKIVFLTGHSEFEYARRAISPCVVAYVLKLEGDKKILEALDRAQAAVDEAFAEKSRRLAMESDLRLAKPLMQAECLRQMIRGVRREDGGAFARQLEAAGIALSLMKPMLIATAIMRPEWQAAQRAQAQEVLANWVSEHYALASGMLTPDACLLLAQARDGSAAPGHLMGAMEKAAAYCAQSDLGMPRIFVYGQLIAAEQLPRAYSALTHARYAGLESDGVRLCMPAEAERAGGAMRDAPVMGAFRVEALNTSLACADSREFFRVAGSLQADVQDASPLDQLTAYTTLASLLLQAIANHLPGDVPALHALALDRATDYHAHGSFPEAMRHLDALASGYFEARKRFSSDSRSQTIHAVNRYIIEHIAEPFGLAELAELVRLHPTYLSRIYKEAAGISINRYIVSQRIGLAQSLLADPSLKISEIVARTGLNTPSYFTYYFKKHMGITPQEYRSQLGI